jgi:hypothetical protein
MAETLSVVSDAHCSLKQEFARRTWAFRSRREVRMPHVVLVRRVYRQRAVVVNRVRKQADVRLSRGPLQRCAVPGSLIEHTSR